MIDELADLMMVASNEVEESICPAGADGARRRHPPDPGDAAAVGRRHHRAIKANLPSRISFRVSSKTDSRTILDGNGAEQLLGKGDMLFLPPASSRCIRLHGPYISEQESARLASFLRKQGKPVFDETITAEDEKTRPRRRSSSRRTSSTTRPRASSSAAGRCRSRTCSASCASASAAPRGSWT